MNNSISVVTINYNNVKGLVETCNSIFSQTYKNFEFIVIDAFSNDGSILFLENIKNRIDKLVVEKDEGIYDAMNKGKELASGDWIIYMNSGDEFYNSKILESAVNYLTQTEAGVVYGDVNIKYDSEYSKIKECKNLNFKYGMPFCTQSVFISKKHLIYNSFNTDYKVFGDLDYFFDLHSKNIKMEYINITISNFDYNGISSKFSFAQEYEKFKVLKKYNKKYAYLYLPSILDRFLRYLFKMFLPKYIKRKIQLIK